MLRQFLAVISLLCLSVPQGVSAQQSPQFLNSEQEIQHSGGCRKSSPPGQCCHAGSKPLHCH